MHEADELAQAVATVRTFAAASGATRVVVVVDRGDGRDAAVVECDAGGAVEVTHGGEVRAIPAEEPVAAPPHPVPHVHAVPASAIEVDPESGQLSAPIGAVPMLGAAVLALARAFGGRSVAAAELATRDPEQPITIAAREGDPLLLAVGEDSFVLPGAP